MHLRIAIVDGGFSGTGMATCLKQHVVVVRLPSLTPAPHRRAPTA